MIPWSTSRTACSATWVPVNRNVAVAPVAWLQFAVPRYMSDTPVVRPQFASYWNWPEPVPVTLASTMDWVLVVTSARSRAMLKPELEVLRLPVLTMVIACDPAASTGLVHTTPDALRPDA